jgi:hypothetical protein
MGRIVLAVIVGFVLWTILWVAAGQIIAAIAPDAFPEERASDATGLMILFNVLSVVFSIVSGFAVAKIGRAAPMRSAWALAIVLFVVGLVVEITGWGRTPVWYHIVFLILLIPGVMIGAKIGAGTPAAAT